MSNVNIKRTVENIRAGTTAYTPIIEVIVNAIQAIESKQEKHGKINIRVERSAQTELGGALAAVETFQIEDNGVGFTEENRESFDELYSDLKIHDGGKGFGRFICLKYFTNFRVVSSFEENDIFRKRSFRMGKSKEIIVSEKVEMLNERKTGSCIRLEGYIGTGFPEKKLTTISRNLVEKLLPYFLTKDFDCPEITISENDGSGKIILNDYVNNELSSDIKEIQIPDAKFSFKSNEKTHDFIVRIFKLYSPKSKKSKISLVAHKREVTETSIHNYIPEFIDEFYDKADKDNIHHDRNYIIVAYVFSEYLDDNVSLERGDFNFKKDNDIFYEISQNDIEREASNIAKLAVGNDISARQEKKAESVKSYIEEEAPWHRDVVKDIDLASLAYNPSREEIEVKLQKAKFDREMSIKKEINDMLDDDSIENLKTNVPDIVSKLSETSKNDLIHYIALRRNVLDIFDKKLKLDPDGEYSSEGVVHDIIFPRRKDIDTVPFSEHNLWIIDERLNFTEYVSSDKPLDSGNSDRPDLLAFNKRILFRGENEPSNPITIFELKKPMRDDFVNPSSDEDPIQQIIRYVNKIKDGKFTTPDGRNIRVEENTPFYGFVICDLTTKVEKWLHAEKNYTPMPDKLGWFHWHGNINLYIEVLSWEKVLKDAVMRNKIFFHKLGIE